jgi:hypothetical protein
MNCCTKVGSSLCKRRRPPHHRPVEGRDKANFTGAAVACYQSRSRALLLAAARPLRNDGDHCSMCGIGFLHASRTYVA